MRVYQTDESGIFVGITTADKDPLGGDWLIPAGCVLDEPPSFEVGNLARWNGSGWVVEAVMVNDEIEPEPLSQEQTVRIERNSLLSASDWTQVADAPVDQEAWATYRQALRDITDQAGFPHEVVWPVKP